VKFWAIADLHLSFGVPNKEMSIFGEHWQDHHEKLKYHWQALVKAEDVVLIAGDVSWAIREEEVLPDLEWLETLPGKKILVKGNHDYWWQSVNKVRNFLPPSMHVIYNDAIIIDDIAIAGTRLWDNENYCFEGIFKDSGMLLGSDEKENQVENTKIFQREIQRLKISLQAIPKEIKKRIVMTHYPPLGINLEPNEVTTLLEEYKIDSCVFGHLHNVRSEVTFGIARGVRYELTSCDYLKFIPKQLY